MANLSKFQRMQRFFPNFYALGQNQVLTGFMGAVCEADENIVVQIEETKNQLFVNFADGKYLDLLGSSYGVYRPSVVSVNDVYLKEN